LRKNTRRPVEWASCSIAISLDVGKPDLQNVVEIGHALFNESLEPPWLVVVGGRLP
jgi:hypothetical protein